MWQVDNRTPFAAERTWTRGRDGAEIWLVAVKCTFDVLPDGSTAVAAEQPPVNLVPQYLNPDNPSQSSLICDVDLVRTKETTDVILHGHAYAPQSRPVTRLEVGMRVGPVVKRLHVTGDRVWRGGSISSPHPFIKMPLTYERAFGGFDRPSRDRGAPQWDMRNPAGCGFAMDRGGVEGMAVPNVEYPDQLITRWKDRPEPAGFGPIGAHWQPRAQCAGTYDERWQQERQPLLPDDFNDRYYQCAPADQQAPHFLRGGEPVVLVNLSPGGELRFELPRVYLGLETFFTSGERQRHDKPRLHTVILEPDMPRVSLVWHSALPCHPMVYKLDRTRIVEKVLLSRPAAVTAEVA